VRLERASQSTSVLAALQDLDLTPAALSEDQAAGFALGLGETVVVGRDAAAGVVLDTPNVSRLHARLTRKPDGIVVEDLGSTNGTWVNGQRILKPTLVRSDDDLRIGPQRLQFTADGKVKQDRKQGGASGVRLDASKLVRSVGPAKAPITIIDGVSFSILPGEMVAIMGPSGAGKTSVLTTIAGYTPPSSGTVYMDGLSLYKHYDVFRRAIGYVPQEDVMHRTLTVEEVLYYKARLDFPAEVTDDEIRARITTVLRQLDLEKQRDTIVGDAVRRGLSGGQRRRLNVAMELLAEPSLLLLDEPTSGLDARSAMQLIRQCRGLANGGRTVAMTIHQPRREAFELFDKLLLLTKGGKLAYFGPTREVKRYFSALSEMPPESANNPADYVLDVLDPVEASLAREPEHWRKQFKKSHFYDRFVRSRLTKEDRSQEREAGRRRRGGGAGEAGLVRQTVQLTRRYALLKWRDRQALAVQMAQSPIIGLLAVLLFYKGRYFPMSLQDDVTPTLFVVMASAVWFGCSNVAREIVGEAAIFRRERMGSLRPGPYLASKLIVQGALVAVQIGTLLGILIPSIPLEGGVLPLVGVALLAGWSAMAMGLLVSAFARTELQSIQLIPLVILPQIMLSGILLPVAGENASKMALWLSKPMLLRWAYAASLHVEFARDTLRGKKAVGSSGAEYWQRSGFGPPEIPIAGSRRSELDIDAIAGMLHTDVAVMAGLGLACVGLTWFLLSRRDRR
jgi:ABC-type multidrug transport system ATPase subunit